MSEFMVGDIVRPVAASPYVIRPGEAGKVLRTFISYVTPTVAILFADSTELHYPEEFVELVYRDPDLDDANFESAVALADGEDPRDAAKRTIEDLMSRFEWREVKHQPDTLAYIKHTKFYTVDEDGNETVERL